MLDMCKHAQYHRFRRLPDSVHQETTPAEPRPEWDWSTMATVAHCLHPALARYRLQNVLLPSGPYVATRQATTDNRRIVQVAPYCVLTTWFLLYRQPRPSWCHQKSRRRYICHPGTSAQATPVLYGGYRLRLPLPVHHFARRRCYSYCFQCQCC